MITNNDEDDEYRAKMAVPPASAIPSSHSDLHRVLMKAFEQSAKGKGQERHGNGKSFMEQPIMEIGRMVGMGYQTGQVMKKVQEATTMNERGQVQAAQAELLGAIVYCAAAYLFLEERRQDVAKAV